MATHPLPSRLGLSSGQDRTLESSVPSFTGTGCECLPKGLGEEWVQVSPFPGL